MFDNLIGNNKIKKELEKVLENNSISHCYLFIGTQGIGKKEFAKEFAKGILCINKTSECLECKSCVEFQNDNNPDFYYIGLGEENSIKIEDIRKMQKKVQELPIVSNRKVYIIDDSDFMTKEAQNCLLKTIEEPPEFVTVILIASNENKILNTIKSRALKIYFNNIESEELKKYLETTYQIKELPQNLLKAYGGSIGKAIKMNKYTEEFLKIEKVFTNVEKYNIITATKELEVLYKEKEIIEDLLEYINVIFLDKAKKDIKFVDYINVIEEVKKKIKSNCNYDMTIDSLIFSIW